MKYLGSLLAMEQKLSPLYWCFPLLLSALFFSNYAYSNNAKVIENKKNLTSLQKQIIEIQKNLTKIEQSKNVELKQLKKTDLYINQLIKQIYQLNNKIEQLEIELSLLKRNIKINKKRLQQHKQILGQQLLARYHTGQQEFVKLLLNQQNPAIFGRILNYYQYFHQARIEQINIVEDIIIQLDSQQAKLHLLQQEIELQQYLKNNEKSNLESQQQQRKKIIAQLSNQHQDTSIELKQLQQNEQQLIKLLIALQQAIKKAKEAAKVKQLVKIKPSKPFKKLKRQLKWPLKGKLKKLYGHWRSVGKVKWKGNIIHSPEGRHVYSIANGRVVYSDWLRGYGLLTIIDHGKGYMSLYGYSQALLKSVGDVVAKDEVIATAGRTSGRRKAGIYFEIRYNGKATNPNRWCQKMPAK